MAKKPKNPFPSKGRVYNYEDWTAKAGQWAHYTPDITENERINILRENTAPEDFPARLSKIAAKYPGMSPGIAVGLAGVNANADALATAARLDTYGQQKPATEQGGAWLNSINSRVADAYNYLEALKPGDSQSASNKDKQDAGYFRALKSATRYITTGLYTGIQLLVNAARTSAAEYDTNMNIASKELLKQYKIDPSIVKASNFKAGPLASDYSQIVKDTYLYQNLVEKKSLGEGFFWGGEALTETERIASEIATINGAAWTPGRSWEAKIGIDPEDRAYGILSGIIDGAITVRLDPAATLARARAVAKSAKYTEQVKQGSTIAADIQAGLNDATIAAQKEGTKLAAERTADARKRAQMSEEELRLAHKDIIDEYRLQDQLIADGKLGMNDKKLENLRRVSGIDNLYEYRTRLMEQVNLLKNQKVPVRDASTGEMLSLGKSAKFLREEVSKLDKQINDTLDTIYVQNDPVSKLILNIAREQVVKSAEEFKLRTEQKTNLPDIQQFVEKHRAGLLESSVEYGIAKEKAKTWLANGNADEFLQTLADETSPYAINKASKGKFGAEISAELAAAKTIDDVEQVLFPRLGIQILPDVPRGIVGRYITKPLSEQVLRSGAEITNTSKLNRAVKSAFDFAPRGRPVHLQDTERLAEEVRRWMVGARYTEDEISQVWNDIVISDEHNYSARVKIITDMLDNTATRYKEELNLSPRMQSELARITTAYKSELNGLRQYSSLSVGDEVGKKAIVNGDMVDISGVPTSVAQLGHEIVLPNVNYLRELTGIMAKVSRSADAKIAKATNKKDFDLVERTSYATARFSRSAADGFLRQVLMVGRVAFVARNIMEMQVRSYLSGGKSIVSNPVEMIALAVSSGRKETNLRKLAELKDPYTVDVNGKRFSDQSADIANTQGIFNSHFNMLQERGFAIDGRNVRGAVRSGGFGKIKLDDAGRNTKEYVDALAHRLLMHYADPMKKAIATQTLPKKYMAMVSSGKMSFEDAFIRAIRDGVWKNQVDVLSKSVEPVRRLLSTDEGMRQLFFTDQSSYAAQISNDTLGNTAFKKFVGTGAIEIDGNVVFKLSNDYVKNLKQLRKILAEEIVPGSKAFERATQVELPYIMQEGNRAVGWYNKFADDFFRISGNIEQRFVYGPEYRVAYWKAAGDLAPLMTKEAALKFLDNADDIRKTRVATTNADGVVEYAAWTRDNPAIQHIIEASKTEDGVLTAKQIDEYARDAASKHVAKLFYDASQKRNYIYMLQLVFPFANAWANTLYKWSELSSSPTSFATRVMPSIKLFSTLQSDESSAIYDVFGTPHDPRQGFVHENAYGEKVFTIPMSGYLRTAFGAFGDPRQADITMPVQSLNLITAGASLPGSDIGIVPGIGSQLNIAYTILPSKFKESIPPILGDLIAPYGDKSGNVIGPLPSWVQKIAYALVGNDVATLKFAKGIMAYEATSNPKYRPLFDGSPLSIEERATLQEDLASNAMTQSRWQYFMQGLLQSALPGTPVFEYYAKNQNGDSFFQWQMSDALNKMIDKNNGNFDLAYAEYGTLFGRQAIMATVSTSKDQVFASDRAWQFAASHPSAFNAYADVIPYFFPGTDFSTEYKVAMERRGKGKKLSANEMIAEADKLTITAAKGQLAIYAARNNLGADWIDEQMKNYKMDSLQGYEPEVSVSTNRLAQKMLKIESALKRPEFSETPAGIAAVQYVNARNAALRESKTRGLSSLAGADNIDLRQQLDSLGQQLSQGNPDFANLFNRVYAQELRTQ